jgi:hypothetical protein
VAPVTFTFDLEDSRPSPALPARFPAVTERVLAFLGARGTFFVVGELAAKHPELMAAIARAGHEVGLHGWRHVPLDKLAPAQLAEDLRRGRAAIEDATGAPARGFRAPIFSLCRRTLWAVDALVEAGFAYSSSVLPAANPLYGYPEGPARPFRWETGLVELPCAVAGRGPAAIPFLGGVYLRYLPMRLVLALARRIAAGPRLAHRAMKENLNRALTGTLEDALDLEATLHLHTATTEDHREAATAFVEKREPVFRGR